MSLYLEILSFRGEKRKSDWLDRRWQAPIHPYCLAIVRVGKFNWGWGRELLSFDAEETHIGANDLLIYKLGLLVGSMNLAIDHLIE